MLRNIGSNWVLTLVTIAATYITTPFIIHTLGQEGYGTWTLIVSMTGFVSLLALGVPMACIRYLAQHVAESNSKKINETIGTCAGMYLGVGAAAMVAGAVAGMFFAFYDIPASVRTEAYLAFAIMVLFVSVGFIGLLPEGIMFAHHNFLLRNLVRIGGVVLRLGLTVALLTLRASLVLLATIQLAGFVFDFGVSWLLIRRNYPEVRISLADFDWGMCRRIFSFSVYVLLLSAGGRLSFETDALVIGALLGVGSIAFFAVGNSLILYLMEFVIAIAAVVAPMATKLSTEGKADELREMFLKWSKVALSLTIGAGLFLSVLGPRFFAWWIAPSYEGPTGNVLRILLLSSLVFLPARGVAQPLLIGLGKPQTPTIGFLAAGLLNPGLSLLLARPLGLAGVALGTAIPNILFGLMIVTVACRELGMTLLQYVRYVVPRATLGALPVFAMLLWFRLGLQVQSFGGLVMAGSTMVLIFSLIWILYVYRDDPYVDLKTPFLRLRAWSRA